MRLWIPLCFALSACGVDPDASSKDKAAAQDPPAAVPTPAPVSADRPMSFYVASMNAAPPCAAEREGWLIYVAAENELKACLGGVWTAVPLPRGEKGDQGPQGEPGKDAAADASPPPKKHNLFGADGTFIGRANDAETEVKIDGTEFTLPIVGPQDFAFDTSAAIFDAPDVCHFKSEDCSGTCYMTGDGFVASSQSTATKSVIYAPTSGDFEAITRKSKHDATGACVVMAGNYNMFPKKRFEFVAPFYMARVTVTE